MEDLVGEPVIQEEVGSLVKALPVKEIMVVLGVPI
jgi:hypothetical protein